MRNSAHRLLDKDDIRELWSFDLYVKHRPPESLYAALMERYQPIGSHENARLPSIKTLRSRAYELSGFAPQIIDCCVDSCVAFTGCLSNMDKCPICGSDRRDSSGNPRNTFSYLPLIPQLRALYTCPELAQKMRYRHEYNNRNNSISDIFDGERYKTLCQKHVVIEGEKQPYKFFEEEHEIALGLSADGMCPFKRRKNSCWPLLIVNYNLPPDERTHIDNLICVGVVPGPKCPADLNSFLQPLIKELLELARGTVAVDITQRRAFALRAHLIAVFGDIPAITKILEFIGHNGCFPCRFCLIKTVAGATLGGGSHRYCPLRHPDGFETNPLELPLRTHKECVRIGLEILREPSKAARDNQATETGIKGLSLLARLPSISIPSSFPVDLMHMIWQNLVPQLVDLWTGKFNGLDDGLEEYLLDNTVWNAINEACKPSGKTIPTQFGCRVPDLNKRSEFIAESWNMFTSFIAPHLLRQSFRNERYYVHFVRLVKLLRSIVSYDMPRDDIPVIRRGIAEWVEEYEQYVTGFHCFSN